MKNWKKCKLGDVCDLVAGFAFKSKSFGNFSQKVVKISNIQPPSIDDKLDGVCLSDYNEEKLRKYLIQNGDFCLAMTGATIGKMGRYKGTNSVYLNQRVLTFRPKKDINRDFLYYCLSNWPFQAFIKNHIDSETAQPNISSSSIGKFQILCPSLDEQKRIAEILGAFDDKIELLQKQNKTLEDMAKALFKCWFVDFSVVRAKQKGLPKADIMREYHLTDDLYDLFPFSFADSPLGPIPSGWEVKKAQEIADIAIGRTPPRKETKWFSTDSTDTTWISIKDLGNCGVFIGDSSEYLTEDAVSKFKIPMIPTKTVVLSFKLTVGRVAITMKEMCSNEAIAQFKDAMVPVEYLYLLLKHINFSLLGSTSSIATAINSNTIKNMNVLIADSVLLSAFKERTQNLFDKIEINLKQIQTLTELRDTLLPRLISGKIRV